jgi:pimeloyl-ACP methyl ester carboxylesterase
VVALLNGMKNRPDRTATIQDQALPLMIIGGMKDNYISVDVFEQLLELAPHALALRLSNSGHMGFVEEKEKAAAELAAFVTLHQAD